MIKVGTSSLLHPASSTLNLGNLARICEAARDLVADGHRVVLVSSGSVGAGAARLGLASRPTDLAAKKALAAIGQVHLMRHYDDFLSALRLKCAQVLLTLDNLAVRSQWRAAASTFEALFAAGGVVPVVNENDTVAVAELRIGDNDTLSAQVATLVRADWLFLMTDVDALYTANPAADPRAARVAEVHDLSALAVNTTGEAGSEKKGGSDEKEGDAPSAASAPSSSSSAAAAPPFPPPAAHSSPPVPSGGAGTQWGTGGMATKLTAARIATAAGCSTAVLHAARPETIRRVIAGDPAAGGTVFHAIPHPSRGRKRWITSVPVKGRLVLDVGAVRAVRERGASLFAAGVVEAEGEFDAQEAVLLVASTDGAEIARGLVNYSSVEVRALVAAAKRGSGNASRSGSDGDGGGGGGGCGCGGNGGGKEQNPNNNSSNHSGSGGGGNHSAEAVLGYDGPDELVHRDNIVMLAPRAPTPTPAVMRKPNNSSSSGSSAAAAAVAAAAEAATAAGLAAASAPSASASSLSAEDRLRQIRERESSKSGDGNGGGSSASSSSRPRVSFDPSSTSSTSPSSSGNGDDAEDDGIMHAAAEAAAAEAAAELAAASLSDGRVNGEEDIDERGWLPK